MVDIHGYIAGKKYIIQYTLVDLAPIAFSFFFFTSYYLTKQDLFFKSFFPVTNFHNGGDGFQIRIKLSHERIVF